MATWNLVQYIHVEWFSQIIRDKETSTIFENVTYCRQKIIRKQNHESCLYYIVDGGPTLYGTAYQQNWGSRLKHPSMFNEFGGNIYVIGI